jgi:hypothetical protein
MAYSAPMTSPPLAVESDSRANSGPQIVLGIAVVAFLVQFLTATRYGIFRDELYYLDCARHLAWGYVDQPPLIALLAWLERHIGGDSLYSIRFLPTLAGAITVWLAGRFARILGADAFGQSLAALAVLASPGFLTMFHILTMNAFEPLFWTAAAYLVIRIIQTGNQKLWLWFGLLSGAGILNKWSMLFFGAGVAIGLVLTRERRTLAHRWIWLGFAIAMVIWLPNVLWNIHHHWPFLELMANVRSSGRDVIRGPVPFLIDQAFSMNILAAPLWIAGALWFFFGRGQNAGGERGRYRVLGWTSLLLFVFFIAAHGKNYYLFPVYPMLFAGGGAAFSHVAPGIARACRPVYAAVIFLAGCFFLPFALPVLSPAGFIHYQQAVHLAPSQFEHENNGPLNQQIFADMFGWDDMVREIARAYWALPPEARAKTGIACSNFGEAGAVDFFGPKYGLPNAISGHQTYWFWGPGNYTGESLLIVGDSEGRARQLCENFDLAGHVSNEYSREDEHFGLYWCHPLGESLQQLWPQAKHFN